jgi:hypothetical protein
MPADPLITPADQRLIQMAKRRGQKAADRVALAIARRAVVTARLQDERREKELADDIDRGGFASFISRPVRREGNK